MPTIRSPQTGIAHEGIYLKMLSVVLAEGRWTDPTDIIEEAKARCGRLGIPLRVPQFHAAVSRMLPRFPAVPLVVQPPRPPASSPPLSRTEAAAILDQLCAAGLLKQVK